MQKCHKILRCGLTCLWAIIVLTTTAPSLPLQAAPIVQTTSETRIIHIPAPEEAKGFGTAIAYDGQTLVVTAPQTDVDGTQEQGMAYIYALDPNDPQNWQLQATATFTSSMEYGWLGESVAVEGDVIVLGAPYVDAPSTPQNGAILIIERTPEDPTWRVTQFERNLYYTEEHGQRSTMGSFANFGRSVAIDKGGNGRILVGAPGSDVYQLGENDIPVRRDNYGGVYTFWRSSNELGSWYTSALLGVNAFAALSDEKGDLNALFGHSVASDTHDDVVNTVIGAPMADVHEMYDNAGKAVQYRSPPNSIDIEHLSPETYRSREDGGGNFGRVVDVHGDFIVIGAYSTDYNETNSAGGAMIKGIHPASIPTVVYASEPHEYANFGRAVAIHNGVVAIGAPGYPLYDFYDWGAVYRFEEADSGEWVEITKYLAPDIDGGGALGQSVDVYEGLVLAGAPDAYGGKGAVYLFDDRPLLEEPIEEEPLGEVPPNLEHLAHEPVDEEPVDEEPVDEEPNLFPNTLFIPATSYETPDMESPGNEPPDHEPPAELLPAIQPLANDNSIQSNYGARLGAIEGTLTTPIDGYIDSYIVAVSPPVTQPHESQTVVGHYYAIGTITTSVVASPEKPFVVGLPVPDGANPAELAAALFVPTADVNDYAQDDNAEWVTVPGAYDAETKLFSFTMSKISKEWILAVLVANPNHIQIEPPEAVTQGQDAADVSVKRFLIRCSARVPATDPLCADQLKDEIETEFINAYHDFIGQGFRPPSLKSEFPYFGAGGPKPGMVLTHRYYGIVIHPAPCPEAGLYIPGPHIIKLCVDPAVGADIKLVDTIRHELFHAIQDSYPALRADWGEQAGWVTEGTAAAAERSLDTMLHSPAFSAREIDIELDRPFSRHDLYAYQVQDFWVYVGQVLGVPLGYLTSIFETGSEPADVDGALGDSLETAYWGWVTNQVYEKEHMPSYRVNFPPCELEMSLVQEMIIGINQSTSFPYTLNGTLTPLNATAYMIEFEQDMGSVSVELLRAGPDTYFKMYQAGEGNCITAPDLTNRYFEANAGDIIYVVVANTGYTHHETHKLVIGAGGE